MPNDIKSNIQASVAATINMTGGIASGAGRMTAAISNPSPAYDGVHIWIKCGQNAGAAPNANSIVGVYLIGSDAVSPNITEDNVGTADAAFTPVNCDQIGALKNKGSPAAGDILYKKFTILDPPLLFSIGLFNQTGQTLSTTAGDHSIRYQFFNRRIE